MPPYLSMPYFHLSKLPMTTKVMLTGFYAALAAAIVFVGITYFPYLMQGQRESTKSATGEDVHNVRAMRDHFAPHEITRRRMKALQATPEQIEEAVRDEQKNSLRKAYDIIHPHSFLMPAIFFILGHLLEMTAVPRWLKIVLYVAGFVSLMTTVFAPLIVFTWPVLAPVCFGLLYVMLGSFLGMIVLASVHMWLIRI